MPKGSVKVNITPSKAIDYGAKWRAAGATEWNDSGDIVEYPVGSRIIEFRDVYDYLNPQLVTVEISEAQTNTVDVQYNSLWPGPDAYGYTAISGTGGFEDIAQTGEIIDYLNESIRYKYWDGSFRIPIGFNFNFYGTNYDSIWVGVNGAASFTDKNIHYDNFILRKGGEGLIKNCIAPWWDDLTLLSIKDNDGNVVGIEKDTYVAYQVKGTAPFRRLIVQWSVKREWYEHYGTITFQFKLIETLNIIKFCYKDVYFEIKN